MKKETLKEFGKGLISLANITGGLSIINGFFAVNQNLPDYYIVGLAMYVVIVLYAAGLLFINKGSE